MDGPGSRHQGARLAAVAFCTGWWLAGAVLGALHYVELWRRGTRSIVELVGVSLIAGIVLPGARPIFAAADFLQLTGLPVGFSAILVGAVLGVAVWGLLPVVVHVGSSRPDQGETPGVDTAIAALPYVGAGVGLTVLYRHNQTRGRSQASAAGIALVTAGVAYLAGALVLFTLALAYLST